MEIVSFVSGTITTYESFKDQLFDIFTGEIIEVEAKSENPDHDRYYYLTDDVHPVYNKNGEYIGFVDELFNEFYGIGGKQNPEWEVRKVGA